LASVASLVDLFVGLIALRLLILSFYYRPDLSAGSFRTTALVDALLERLPPEAQIDVVTTLPNRYGSFTADAPALEEHPQVIIRRIALPAHQSGMLDQSKAFFAYSKEALRIVRGKRYDLVYATSSRLMTAALGSEIARRARVPLYLDIRDIFVDTIKDVLPKNAARLVKPVFSRVESRAVNAAEKVNLVSGGFMPYFRERYPNANYSVFTNGIDEEFIRAQPVQTTRSGDGLKEVLYAGNMGEGQGLHVVIPELAKRFEGQLKFKLIGDGGRRRQLVEAIAAAGCTNVEVVPPVDRDNLIKAYQSADVLFLHLNSYDAFMNVLSSKLFEYAALGKPVWAGVAGHAAEFLSDNVENTAIFPPCDVDAAVESFRQLEMVTSPRRGFVEKYARAKIMREMADDIASVLESA
jgi:glycosyltransferase involved in cell wall biosynthesis